MCQCDPSMRTPFCGKPGCEMPEQKTAKKRKPVVVEFEIDLGEKVKTCFGDIGIVNMLGLDEGRLKKYHVKRNSDSQWFKRGELKLVDQEGTS